MGERKRINDETIKAECELFGLDLVERVWSTDEDPKTPEKWVFNVAISSTKTTPISYYYITRDSELEHLLEWLEPLKEFAIDVETSGLDPFDGHLATVQVGNLFCEDPRAYVICRRSVSRFALEPLYKKLEDSRLLKRGQNIRFECKWLQHHDGVRVRNVADTQIAEMVVRTGLLNAKGDQNRRKGVERAPYRHTSMAALAMRYLSLDIDKDQDLRVSFWVTPAKTLSPRQLLYAGSDVVYPFAISERQDEEVAARKLRSTVRTEYELIPVLADLELTGIAIDADAWRKLWREAVKKRYDAQKQLDKILIGQQGDLFGGSEEQIRPLYYTRKGKPEPLNYSSGEQVRWAIRQYCLAIKWPVTVLTSAPEVWKHKREWGQEWLAKRRQRNEEALKRGELDKVVPVSEKDIPDWVLPEDRFCVLLSADRNTLILRKCRNQLPREIVDPLLEYSTYDIRCDTFGNEFLLKHVKPQTGRIHTEVHQCITSTGRISTSPNCYDGRTEILTPTGWVSFEELENGVEVLQVNPADLKAEFVVPTEVIRQAYSGPMVHLSSTQIDLLVTPNHRMLIQHRSTGRREVIRADEYVADRLHFNAVDFSGVTAEVYTPEQTRLLVAAQADSWIEGDRVEFSFKKERKWLRLLGFLNSLSITYTVINDSRKFRLWFTKPVWFPDDPKRFDSWILRLSKPALEAFVEEVWHWDGCLGVRSQYCSKYRENSDWVQTACSLVGLRARLRPYRNAGGRDYWVVDVTRRNYSMTTGVTSKSVDYDGPIYCVTVPTGMVLVRRKTADGRYVVSVSGNTQNIPSDIRYRTCFRPRPGYKFVIADHSQVEPRITAELSGDPVYTATFLSGDDLYLAVCEAMLGERPDKKTEEGSRLRAIIKTVVLALAYRMGPQKLRDRLTLALHADIMAGKVPAPTFEYANELYERFFEVHEKVREYQDLCAQLADPRRSTRRIWDSLLGAEVTWIESICGRKRFFPPDAQSTWTEGPNVGPQAGSATFTKVAACLIQRQIDAKKIDAHVINLVHDEIVVEVPDDHKEWAAAMVRTAMEKAGQFYCKTVPIKADWPENTQGYLDYWAKRLVDISEEVA